MKKSTTTAPANNVSRTVRLESPGRLSITESEPTGKVTRTGYLFVRIPTELGGAAFTVRKIEQATAPGGRLTSYRTTSTYNVLLLPGTRSTCDCKWGIYGANKKACRHVAGLQALIAQGKLPTVPA